MKLIPRMGNSPLNALGFKVKEQRRRFRVARDLGEGTWVWKQLNIGSAACAGRASAARREVDSTSACGHYQTQHGESAVIRCLPNDAACSPSKGSGFLRQSEEKACRLCSDCPTA